MLASSKMSYYYVITTYQPPVLMTLHSIITFASARAIIKVLGPKYQWLAGG